MLRSIRLVWDQTAKNVNAYDPSKESISVLEFAKRGVLEAMAQIKNPSPAKESVVSSDSDNAQADNDDDIQKTDIKAINDYLSVSSLKAITSKLALRDTPSMSYDDYSKMFIEIIENDYKGLEKKIKYERRIAFLRVAYSTLSNIASSSELERKFGQCMRSISDRRVNLRKIFLYCF